MPIVGHAVLLFQNKSGEWWYTEYNAAIGFSININSIKGIKNTFSDIIKSKESATIYLEKYYDGMLNRFGKNSIGVYITGDFSNCYNRAKMLREADANYGGYNLITNNCLHYIIDVAKSANCGIAYQAYLRLPNVVPINFVTGLAQLQGKLFQINLLISMGIISLVKKLSIMKNISTKFVESYLPCC